MEDVMLTGFSTLSPADTLEDALHKAVHTLQDDFPVVRGLDLVGETFRIAAGEALGYGDPAARGHALQFRIYAEDPSGASSAGTIRCWHPPEGPGIRVDSHAYNGYFVPPNYDSMIGKLIAYGATREQAIKRMRIALSEMVVEGIQTNIPLHRELMLDAKFVEGGTSIHYLENRLAAKQQAAPEEA